MVQRKKFSPLLSIEKRERERERERESKNFNLAHAGNIYRIVPWICYNIPKRM
jgi:hypothetical protein